MCSIVFTCKENGAVFVILLYCLLIAVFSFVFVSFFSLPQFETILITFAILNLVSWTDYSFAVLCVSCIEFEGEVLDSRNLILYLCKKYATLLKADSTYWTTNCIYLQGREVFNWWKSYYCVEDTTNVIMES